MDCKQAARVLFLFFDNQLEETVQKPFEEHLTRCPGCARRVDYTRRLFIFVRQGCSRQHAPSSLRVRILASLPHRQAESAD